ncbi:hypothetical protein F5Y15DRAFT_370874 [Xylariaceae sp. FL0016]|nr:hypothetical protein F5Y15DRAFT_370874 [Xylariaceae sp. FL0016]
MMPEFGFVVLSGAEALGASSSKRAARSHAIRAGIRNSGTLSSKTDGSQSRGSVKDRKKLQGRFRLETTSDVTDRRSRTLSKCASLSRETAADPFNSLPIPNNRQVDNLIKFFLTRFNLNGSCTSTMTLWFPYAIQSAPTMRTTLALSAAFWAASRGFPDESSSTCQLEGMRRKDLLLRLIRKWIPKVDANHQDLQHPFFITSISTLVTAETLQGNFEAATIHLRALHDLWYLLDGSYRFQHELCLRKSVKTSDLIHASAVGRVPLFPLLHMEELRTSEDIQNRSLDFHWDGSSESILDTKQVQIFALLRLATHGKFSGAVNTTSLRILLNSTDYCLLRSLFNSSDQQRLAPSHRLARAVMLAAHLFLYVVLREIPTGSILVRTMTSRLFVELQEMSKDSGSWDGHLSAMQWVSLVGKLGIGEISLDDKSTEKAVSFLHFDYQCSALVAALEADFWTDANM